MDKQIISPTDVWDPKKYGFVHGVLVQEVKKILFVSGQNGIDEEGNTVGKDFESQCKKSFENITSILAAAGGEKENIAKLNAYVTDIKNADAFVRISSDFFGGKFVSQTLVEVKALAFPDLNVEIEAVAIL